MFFDRLVLDKEKGGDSCLLLVDSLDRAVSVAMAPWTLEYRMFVFETYVEPKSIIAVQRRFHTQFNVDRNTILRWVEAFRATGSVMKRKPPSLPATVRRPENTRRKRERQFSEALGVLLSDKLQLCGCQFGPYVAF
jgi:hypothetical protein